MNRLDRIHLAYRIRRRLVLLPVRRPVSVGFWIAGAVSCLTSGLTTLEAPLHAFLGLLVGIAYIGTGALLWGLE